MPRSSSSFADPRSARRAPIALLAFGFTFLSGCYAYVPGRMETVEPGQSVRLRLSPEEAERLAAARRTDLRIMDGTVVRRSEGELLLDIPVGRFEPREGTRALIQRVNVPLSEVRDVELRRRDNLRTGLAVGGLGVAVGIGITAALRGGIGERDGDGDGPAESRRLPLILRLRLPF